MRKKRALLVFASSIELPAALLADSDPTKEPEAKWVQIGVEGDYPGYRNGQQPFSFTRETFDQIIANFRANPSYKAGADGVGAVDVVPWDFHHAGEMPATEGMLPVVGAPSQGWTRELDVRTSADGKTAELWGLTRFLEPARSYVKDGKYRWASVAVGFNTIDPATARNVGAVLTSVALTNQPIAKGMQELIAASLGVYVEQADSAEDALKELKRIFGLPEMSGAPELVAELTKLQGWVTQGGAPLGVNIADVLAGMRRVLNLPALSTELEVVAEATKVISRLVDEQSAGQGQPAPAPASAATAAAAKEQAMDLLKILASKLGVREANDALEAAVVDLADLRAGIQKTLASDVATTSVLLEGVARAISAKAKLTALIKALGVEDADGAVNRVADLMSKAAELAKVMPELSSLRVSEQKREDEAAEADVAEAMASRGYGPEAKEALALLRKTSREKFLACYPKQSPSTQALLSAVVVQPGAKPGAAPKQLPAGQPAINLAPYPGRNPTERAQNYLLATIPGAAKWSFDDLWKAACELKRQPNVVDAQ